MEPSAPSDPVLLARLRTAAGDDGFLPFDRFMEIALYDPGRGFYDRPSTRLGRQGDFYTAAHVHRLFGATLAEHFAEVWRAEGSPRDFAVVEVGPGDGTLAADILTALGGASSPTGLWRYILVERSSALRQAAQAALDRGPVPHTGGRVAEALAQVGPVRGIVLANELMDAFPFRRWQWTADGWTELGVLVGPDGMLRTVSRRPDPVEVPPELPSVASEGAVLEVSRTLEAWIRELADHVAEGRVVLIDYGEEEEALLAKGSAGTLQAIREHRSVDPLSRPGTADLSAWVNFTRVRRTARAAGFRETYYGPLSNALVEWGIDRVRQRLEVGLDSAAAVQLQLAQKSFLLGFGNFKVLELSPGRSSV